MSTRRGEGWQCDHGAQYYTARDPDFCAEVARWTSAGVAQLWSPRLCVHDGISLQYSRTNEERFVGFPRMTAPAHFLAQTLALTAQTTIKQLERLADGWRLQTTEHGWLDERFDAVLLAVPAPQAAPLLQAPAPALAAIASSAVMRGCWALMMRFHARVALPYDAVFVNAGPLRWIARDSSKPGRDGPETWLLHANAQWSESHLEESAENVASALIEAFRKLGGPSPEQWSAHRWRYADTDPALNSISSWNANAGLGICGDWLNGGKVEGAWISGRALALHVLGSPGDS